ncbi:MAG: GNAT family N-acetyltransferase [Clostridium sp.]|nr:GNAT family N-acetyltransferase [Clostridium sp.]
MKYYENILTYKEYRQLRESVGWTNFSQAQAKNALKNSLYTITAVKDNETVAMGRLIGDGQYYMIVDVVVRPDFQKQKIGTSILNRLLEYVDKHTPAGGRSSVQLIAERGEEPFYESLGFKRIPHEFCGCGMRRVFYVA